MRHFLTACGFGLAASFASLPAWSGTCFLSSMSQKPDEAAEVQEAQAVAITIKLSTPRQFDHCERVTVVKGIARAQYLDAKGIPRVEKIVQGQTVAAANIGPNAAPVQAVSRTLVALLTDPKERRSAGQKFFDKPSQVGAPFGDVYIPPQGLAVRFVNLDADAKVQVADSASNAVLLDTLATQGMTLDRARLRAGGTYAVRVLSGREKLPPGAFEVVPQDQASELDQALAAIDAEPLLDADTRAIARALLFERDGLTFNRDLALREMKK